MVYSFYKLKHSQKLVILKDVKDKTDHLFVTITPLNGEVMRKLNHVSEDKIQEMISDRFSLKNNLSAILEKTDIKTTTKPTITICCEEAREANICPSDGLVNYR